MDKIVYESSSPCLETKHYAVAILQDKELHCTPIKGKIQLYITIISLNKHSELSVVTKINAMKKI